MTFVEFLVSCPVSQFAVSYFEWHLHKSVPLYWKKACIDRDDSGKISMNSVSMPSMGYQYTLNLLPIGYA